MMGRFLTLAILFSGIFLPLAPFAADNSDTVELEALMRQDVSREERLGTTVTSVGKRHQKLAETAAAVYVVTQDDLRRSGVTNIPDALRMVPGLAVARIDSNKWAVSARGFNGRFANKLLVLLDGREVYSPTFGGVYWEVQDVPLYDIDRIEVIRGPGASLWGANAVNGVINIITKPASETQGGRLVAGGGTYEQGFGSARYGVQFDEATAGRVWASGFNRGAFDNVTGANNHDNWGLAKAGFRLDQDAQRGNAWLVEGQAYAGKVNQTLLLPSPQAPYKALYRNQAAVSGFNLLGRWKTAPSLTSEITLQGFYDHTYRNEIYLTEQRDTLDLDFQHRFLWWDNHSINWGLGYRVSWDRFGDTDYVQLRDTRAARQLFSAFLQDDISLLDNTLTLTFGSKLQHNDYTGFEIQPSFRVVWNPNTRNVLWGAVSRGVRIPSRAENNSQFRGGTLSPLGTVNPTPYSAITVPVGSKQFKTEDLISYEIGYRFKPDTNISLDVALFYNDYIHLRGFDFSDTIIQFNPQNPPYWNVFGSIANSMNAQAYGMEWLVDWRPIQWWNMELAYTVIKSNYQSLRGPGNFSSEQGYNPEQQVSFRSGFDIAPNLDMNFWLRYVDTLPLNPLGTGEPLKEIPSYVTLDTRLAWRPLHGLELSVVGQNLLHNRHLEFEQETLGPLRSYVPRSVYFQLDWRF